MMLIRENSIQPHKKTVPETGIVQLDWIRDGVRDGMWFCAQHEKHTRFEKHIQARENGHFPIEENPKSFALMCTVGVSLTKSQALQKPSPFKAKLMESESITCMKNKNIHLFAGQEF